MIFFALTEAMLPDPIPTPANTPKWTQSGPETETDPKRTQTDPKRTEMDPKRPKWTEMKRSGVGQRGGLSGWGGGCIRVKQVRFGKLAFLQQNGAFFGPKNRHFRPFRATFSVKKFGPVLVGVVREKENHYPKSTRAT